MADEGFKRKLTAILSTDAVDYSRLMGEDEETTVRTLKAYREVFSTLIQQHNGKVLDSPGDNLLAEFASVVDAVQCAVAVQKEIKARNDELPENRRMQFRIGINLGDVIQEEGRIYGDGVNIAARLEGLAEPGGICISKTAFDHIESKLPYGYDFLGDQPVKNIAKPVGAYRVLMDPRVTASGKPIDKKSTLIRRKSFLNGAAAVLVIVIAVGIWQYYNRRPPIEPVPVGEKTLPIPEKPSIAVMPFNNMSGDPEQDFIGDGISESIISALSKIPYLFVIARNSTFFYKGKPVKITQVGQELGVKYVLEGSVLRSGDKVRINAQLIDALKGHHIWSETYDRQWTEFISILDEITLAVARALTAEVGMPFGDDPTVETTDNVEAWLILQEAAVHFTRYTQEDNVKAKKLAKQAIEIDPNYAKGYAALTVCLTREARYGWGPSPKESMMQAKEMAQKALELNESLPNAYWILGELDLMQRNYDDALVKYKKALDLNPSLSTSYAELARCMFFSGQIEEALSINKTAERLNPHYDWGIPLLNGKIYYHLGSYKEALVEFEKLKTICLRGDCTMFYPHLYLAMVYGKTGQDKDARFHMEKALEIKPRFNLEARSKTQLHKNKEDTERENDGLRKAGAPEHPPSQ
jgi:TolB-like protein/class 3 adenylate cyclase